MFGARNSQRSKLSISRATVSVACLTLLAGTMSQARAATLTVSGDYGVAAPGELTLEAGAFASFGSGLFVGSGASLTVVIEPSNRPLLRTGETLPRE